MAYTSFKKMKILLMDESSIDLLLLQDMLTTSGYTDHKGFTDLSLSIAIAAIYEPDLIVLALESGRERSFEILEKLHLQTREDEYRPILVVLKNDDSHFKRRALRYGATDFLTKPFDYTDALLRIGNLLQTRQLSCAQSA